MKISNLLNEFRNEKSHELFKKNISELNIEENIKLDNYIHDLANPIWKSIYINGFQTHYSVSNTGFVCNIKTGRLRKGIPDTQGYQRIMLSIKNYQYPKKIHRLVAETFLPNPENKPQVNHINGNKALNWVGNLEWVTCKENIQHSYETGLVTNHAKGEQVGTNKYKEEQIREVCKLLQDPKKRYEDIAKITGVSYDVISKVGTGLLWNNLYKEYNIPSRIRHSKYSDEYIENICKMLAAGVKSVEIHNSTGISWSVLSNIKHKKAYIHITNKYAF